MGKCQQKSVWLFVHAIIMARSPSFGKTLLTRILHIILYKNSIAESLILLNLSCFWFYVCLSPVLKTKNYVKTCDNGDILSRYSPVFDERNIWLRLSGGCGHRTIIPLRIHLLF